MLRRVRSNPSRPDPESSPLDMALVLPCEAHPLRMGSVEMPEISRFFGIVIFMPPNDHLPPHFHATYGGTSATIELESGALMAGRLPPRILGLVAEWSALHREELRVDWELTRARRPLNRIAPLE
jgi:hypothetical protein